MLFDLLHLCMHSRRRRCRELRGDDGELLLELVCLVLALFCRCRSSRFPGERVGAFLQQLVLLPLLFMLVLCVLLLVL